MEAKHADIQKEIKRAEKRGSRKGILKRIGAFLLGIIIGIIAHTGILAYRAGENVADSFKSLFVTEEGAEGRDITIKNFRLFGYKAADFEDAILGDGRELKKLEVYSREVSDVVTLVQTGLGKIEAFSKYQYITYNGRATYTVDLSGLSSEDIIVDPEAMKVSVKVPAPMLEPINIQSDNIEFGEVERKSIFAFGDIKLTPEDQARVETEARKKMEERLVTEKAADDAKTAAEHAIWEIFQPMVSGVSPKYTLMVEFK